MVDMNPLLLDVRNLLCPMPVIRLQACVDGKEAGQGIKVLCNAESARKDLKAWCRVQGHELISEIEHQEDIELLIQIGSGA
jgi:tRNA 2-thiouridine synthesizing protein A